MAEYGGGFAGDRAGLMNLQQTLAGVTQNQMQGRQMDMMRQNMMFQQGMAQKEFANTQAQQGFQRRMMPWQIAAMTPGFTQMTPPEKENFISEMQRRIMGGRPIPTAGGGTGETGTGAGASPNPSVMPNPTETSGQKDFGIGLDIAGGALGGVMAAPLGPWGILGGSALGYNLTDYANKKLFEQSQGMSNPAPTPVFPSTPMAGAMGQAINSTSAKNVTKRNNRAVKTPNMDSVGLPSQPSGMSLPSQ